MKLIRIILSIKSLKLKNSKLIIKNFSFKGDQKLKFGRKKLEEKGHKTFRNIYAEIFLRLYINSNLFNEF